MRRILPPMNALLAFEAAARLGSFTRAAQSLTVAQPAVTRQIAKLEDWVGAPLFHRNGNRITLTKDGEALSELATSVLDRLELGVQEIARQDGRSLLLGASFGIAHLWVMPRIAAMRSASRATINILTNDDYRALDASGVDLSIRFGNGKFGDLATDMLIPERCRIIAAPAFLDRHPDFDPTCPGTDVSPALLLDHADPHSVGWLRWKDWYEMTGAPFPGQRRLTQMTSYPTMLDLICAGKGIGIGSDGLEDALVQDGTLVRIGPELGRAGWGYFLVYRPALRERPTFERLRAHLLGQVAPDAATAQGVSEPDRTG